MKRLAHPLPQRGAATLVIVMMLFIVMALLAAYANRSLLFEQRIAGSYARATLAQEMSEAGIEWAVAMVNGPAIDEACKPADMPTGQRFVDRYLKVDASDRTTKPLVFKGATKEDDYQADCTRKGGEWVCRCPKPDATRAAPAPTAGDGLVPSFGIRFRIASPRNGVVMLVGKGCTDSVVDNCGLANPQVVNSSRQLATASTSAQLALVSAVRSPPAAPLVATGDLQSKGAGIGLHNTDPRTAGLLFVLGGEATGNLIDGRLESLPGTPFNAARLEKDAVVGAATVDVFRMFMGMKASKYMTRPGLYVVTCGTGNCKIALEKAYAQGWRMLWVNGALELGDGANLGSEADPVVVVANGAVKIDGALQLTGLLVSLGNLQWMNASALPSIVTGAVLVQGAVETDGAVDIFYRQSVSDQLRNRLGSYVRVPGEWTDQNQL